jgi:hypothetical protein
MVTIGKWTQKQAGDDLQYWKNRSDKAITGDINSWFVDKK